MKPSEKVEGLLNALDSYAYRQATEDAIINIVKTLESEINAVPAPIALSAEHWAIIFRAVTYEHIEASKYGTKGEAKTIASILDLIGPDGSVAAEKGVKANGI